MKEFPLNIPIVVDLDGTLILTDMGRASLKKFFFRHPHKWLILPLWLIRGRAHTKARLAELIHIEPEDLLYNDTVIDYIKHYKAKGHRILLATGANMKYAQAIADHVGLFDEVLASCDAINNISRNKAERLVKMFGEKGYVYLGNSSQDLAVWQHAFHAVAVNTPQSVLQRLKNLLISYEVLDIS